MTPEMKVAILRAVGQAFIQFGGMFFFMRQFVGIEDAITAAGFAAFIALGYRAVGEGTFDSRKKREPQNIQNPFTGAAAGFCACPSGGDAGHQPGCAWYNPETRV